MLKLDDLAQGQTAAERYPTAVFCTLTRCQRTVAKVKLPVFVTLKSNECVSISIQSGFITRQG